MIILGAISVIIGIVILAVLIWLYLASPEEKSLKTFLNYVFYHAWETLGIPLVFLLFGIFAILKALKGEV